MTTYYYDAFGRRIAKASDTKVKTKFINGKHLKTVKHHIQQQKTKQQTTLMLWDGNRQTQEYTDTHVFTTVYEQDSFDPVARLVWLQDRLTIAANDEGWYGNNKPEPPDAIQVYHYHNDHLGTPNELTNSQGEVIWLADYQAWGNTAKVVWREEKLEQLKVAKENLQPLRFQGQYYDEETGLHYNRFRYFDPNLGMFTSRDPIGLMGGNNVFQYAPNPTGWIDPFGLIKKTNLKTQTVTNEKSCHEFTFDPTKSNYYYSISKRESVFSHIRNGHMKPTEAAKGKYFGSDDKVVDMTIV